jgi:starch synthase
VRDLDERLDAKPAPLRILLAASECTGLAKVGGLADVVADLSSALNAVGESAAVIIPFYDVIQCDSCFVTRFQVRFGGRNYPVEIHRTERDGVPTYLVSSRDFFSGDYRDVYIHSQRLGRGPFEDDAKRFAFFSASVMAVLEKLPEMVSVEVLHCHDWHTGTVLALLNLDPARKKMARRLRTVFTIHNLDYQGTRPLDAGWGTGLASFAGWFPRRFARMKAEGVLERLADRRFGEPCYNPMLAGILYSDVINTVSPTYAGEITKPDDDARNFIGGRGLETFLKKALEEKRLIGILNGINYEKYDPAGLDPPFSPGTPHWRQNRGQHRWSFLGRLKENVVSVADRLGDSFPNSARVIEKLRKEYRAGEWLRRPFVVAVTRAARMKMSILLEPFAPGKSVLEEILSRDLSFVIIGRGELEEELEKLNDFPNGLFLRLFDPGFADLLYAGGDIFLMPSDFEPCGLSQMIALRFGNLPLANDIGGLHDTIEPLKNGFLYSGRSREEARRELLKTLDLALDLWKSRKEQWAGMQVNAMNARFEWKASAAKYLVLYRGEVPKPAGEK